MTFASRIGKLIRANLLGLIAIYIALGGVALALQANSVRSNHIVDGQVKTPDLATDAVTSAKIRNGEVRAADIRGRAVTNAKLADDSVTNSKIPSFVFHHEAVAVESGSDTQTIQCPGGAQRIGGGLSVGEFAAKWVSLVASYPVEGNKWEVVTFSTRPDGATSAGMRVMCLE